MPDDEFSLDIEGLKSLKAQKSQAPPAQAAPEQPPPREAPPKRRRTKARRSDEPLRFDWRRLLKNEALLVALLVLIPFFVAAYVRTQAVYLPQAEEWAKNSVHNYYRGQIAGQINGQYPNLPASEKAALVNEELNKFLRQNKAVVSQQISETADRFKSEFQYVDKNGRNQTYLADIDTWFYFRRVRNLAEKGHVWDVERDGVKLDDHMNAPLGAPIDKPDFHSLFSFLVYKAFALVDPNVNVMFAFSLVSVIISALSAVPAFFIARRFAGNFGGFAAGVILATNIAFLGRSTGGTVDTDAYNVMFPLFIAWAFLEAFEAQRLRVRLVLGGVAGLLMGLFSYAWSGWWYIFDFILGTLGVYIAFILVRNFLRDRRLKAFFTDPHIRQTLQVVGVFLVASFLFVSVFSGVAVASKAPFFALQRFTAIKAPAKEDLWPNVFTTVAELNPSTLGSIVRQVGGAPYKNFNVGFYIGALGLIFALFRPYRAGRREIILVSIGLVAYAIILKTYFLTHPAWFFTLLALPIVVGLLYSLRHPEVDVKFAVFLTLWFIGTMYAGLKGTRFILLLVPAFALAFGVALGRLHNLSAGLLHRSLRVPRLVASLCIVILLGVLFLVQPIKAANEVGKNQVPIVSDGWWDALTKIREQAAPDAIINSWWDFGHWFKAIADRRVTFDGATQNTPMAHWIGEVLITDDVDLAMGILRMLDCGSNTAFDVLQAEKDDIVGHHDLLHRIVRMDKEEARRILAEAGVSEAAQSKVIEKTHCAPPDNYFITSGDMVGKAGVWAHFGAWDFRRAFIYNAVKRNPRDEAIALMQARLNLSEEEAEDYYNQVAPIESDAEGNSWISPWPNYVSQNKVRCGRTGESEMFRCVFNVGLGPDRGYNTVLEAAMINASNITNSYLVIATVDSGSGQKVGESRARPAAFAVTEASGIVRYPLPQHEIGFDVIFDTTTPAALMLDPRLVNSTFTKLFYLEGRYMDHFDLFDDRMADIQGLRIVTWTVDWDGKSGQEQADFDAMYKEHESVVAARQAALNATSPPPAEDVVGPSRPRNETENDTATPTEEPRMAPIAIIETEKGLIKAELFSQDAPITVQNFIGLAKAGFYDGLTFHRVEPGFVIQTGDPTGTGSGGSNQTIPLEASGKHNHTKGALGMARKGDDLSSATSQFYITLADTPFLDGKYAVFGQVVEGMEAAEKIAQGDTVVRITIEEP